MVCSPACFVCASDQLLDRLHAGLSPLLLLQKTEGIARVHVLHQMQAWMDHLEGRPLLERLQRWGQQPAAALATGLAATRSALVHEQACPPACLCAQKADLFLSPVHRGRPPGRALCSSSFTADRERQVSPACRGV